MTRRVAFDASFLAVLTDEATPMRTTSCSPEEARDRLAYLLERLDLEEADVVIPTPVLAEVLVVATREVSRVLAELENQARFRVVGFDTRAAQECGIMMRNWLPTRSPEDGRVAIKFDAMILAIAVTEQATVIYADDDRLRKRARKAGLQAFGFDDLPPRPTPPQGELLDVSAQAPARRTVLAGRRRLRL